MITTLTSRGLPSAIDKLNRLDALILTAMQTGLARGLESAVQMSQREYLSGPRPLRLDIITTRLRRSITSDINIVGTNQVIGTIGSNVRYAAFHEFGFHGTEQVRGFLRSISRLAGNGGTFDGRRNVHRRPVTSVVPAHTRQVNYAGRPFLAPALERSLPLIMQDIKEEIVTATAK